MSKAVAEIAVGVAVVAGAILLGPAGAALVSSGAMWSLISAGASLTLSGVGTLLSKGPLQGVTGNIRSPISPWISIYGRSKTGGTIIAVMNTGETDKYLHLVFVLACHPCEAVDSLYFNNGRVTLDTSGNSLSYVDSTAIIAHNQTVNISSISRANDVVTVVLSSPFPLVASSAAEASLLDGDHISIHGVTTDATLNGTYPVQVLSTTSFTYLSGGTAVTITGQGQATTTFEDWGDTVHMEVALGTQDSGSPPFPGLLATDDTGSGGLWTDAHLLQGRTAVYLRLKYGGDTYAAGGVPSVTFLVRGKNDISDPRTSPATIAYSENPALCIADYLANSTWGFKANYGTEIPLTPLISAANICDETVTLANGSTEPRYSCNGQFPLTTKRGDVLQNLLTSCGGRLTYVGGQFVIHPAAWIGASSILGTGTSRAFATASLKVLSSHTPPVGMTIGAQMSAHFPWGDSPSIGTIDLNDSSSWTLRTDTIAVATYFPTLADATNMVASFRTQATFSTGSLPDDFRIYDVWLDVVYADDSSTATLRPTIWQVIESDGFPAPSTVTNGANGIDSDTSSYADISLTGYNIFAQFSKCLQVSGFSSAAAYTPGTPVAIDNAAGPFTWKSKVSVRDLYNGVKGTYISPANSWQSSDFPAYAQDQKHGYSSGSPMYPFGDANLAADGGDRRWFDVQLPFTISSTMAQRLAKIELLRRRWQGTGTFAFNLAMYKLTTLDVVALTLPVLGWSGKLLEVTAHRFTVTKNDDATLLGTELDLKETDPSIYEWDVSEELSAQGYSQVSALSDLSRVAAPTGLALANNAGSIRVTWNASTDGYVLNGGSTIVEYSLDNSNWVSLGTLAGSATSVVIPNVVSGQNYWVRVAFVNVAGAQSAWATAGPLAPSSPVLDSATAQPITDSLGNPIYAG